MGDIQRSAGRLEPYEDRPWVPRRPRHGDLRVEPAGVVAGRHQDRLHNAYGRIRRINGDGVDRRRSDRGHERRRLGATAAHAAEETDLIRGHATVLVAGRQAIGFVRANFLATPRGKQAIFVMNANGTGVRRVTPWAYGPAITPTGRPTASGSSFARRSPAASPGRTSSGSTERHRPAAAHEDRGARRDVLCLVLARREVDRFRSDRQGRTTGSLRDAFGWQQRAPADADGEVGQRSRLGRRRLAMSRAVVAKTSGELQPASRAGSS